MLIFIGRDMFNYGFKDEAEMRVIEELRQMGSEALHCWSEHKITQTIEDFDKEHSTAIKEW